MHTSGDELASFRDFENKKLEVETEIEIKKLSHSHCGQCRFVVFEPGPFHGRFRNGPYGICRMGLEKDIGC